MQAINEGAGPEYSFAVNIRLPYEQKPNPVVDGNPRLIVYKYFFNRKVAFLKEANAIVLFPGGFGTLDEAMETLTLLQTGKHDPLPLILVDEPAGTYWLKWLQFFEEELVSQGLPNTGPTPLGSFFTLKAGGPSPRKRQKRSFKRFPVRLEGSEFLSMRRSGQ